LVHEWWGVSGLWVVMCEDYSWCKKRIKIGLYWIFPKLVFLDFEILTWFEFWE
jgi:hypothetical protein